MLIYITIACAVIIMLGFVASKKISAFIAAENTDIEIRRKLEAAVYQVDTKILKKLQKQYSADQLTRCQSSIDNALAKIDAARKYQEGYERAMMAEYTAYAEADDPFEKCELGRELPDSWHEAVNYRYKRAYYSEDFQSYFRALLDVVAQEVDDLAKQLYVKYLDEARAGNQVSFDKVRKLIEKPRYKLVYPADWVHLVGMHVECPNLMHYGRVRNVQPSQAELRLYAIQAIQEADGIKAKLSLAYADFGKVGLEEELRVQLGQIVFNFNLERAQQQN